MDDQGTPGTLDVAYIPDEPAFHGNVRGHASDLVDLPPVDDSGSMGDVLPAEPLAEGLRPASADAGLHGPPVEPQSLDPLDDPMSDPSAVSPDAWAPPRVPSDAWAAPAEASPARARVKVRHPPLGAERPPSAPRFTGERNEDSILFDMSVVPTRNLRESAPAPSDADTSGLIDISRMAAASAATTARSERPGVDQLLTVGSSAPLQAPLTGGLLAPVTPPVSAAAFVPPPAPAVGAAVNKTIVISAAIVALIVTTGICTVLVLFRTSPLPEPQSPVTASAVQPPAQSAPVAAPPVAAPPVAAPPVAAPPVAAPPVAAPPVAAPPAAALPSPARPVRPPVAPPPADQGTQAAASPRAHVPAHADHPAAAEPTQYHAPPSATANAGDLPQTPSRAEVVTAMQPLAVIVRACGGGSEPAMVDITFAGSGRVTTATVRPPYAGTPTGSCIARAVRAARVEAFSLPTFRVSYPFTLQ